MIDQQKHDEQIRANRRLMRGECSLEGEEFVSDQMLQKPQPPLTKPPMRPETERIALPRQFESLIAGVDLLSTFRDRRSARVYTGQPVSLLQLSFLLWVTQGVKALRGKGYATLRTVPSGGARHAFETYLIVQHVDGLLPIFRRRFLPFCRSRSGPGRPAWYFAGLAWHIAVNGATMYLRTDPR